MYVWEEGLRETTREQDCLSSRGLFRHRASLLMPWPWFLSRSSIDERDWSRSAMRRWPCWYGFAWLLLTNNRTPRSRTTSARWMAGESDRTSFRSSAKCALFTMSGINFQIHFSSHQSFFRFTSLRSCQPVFSASHCHIFDLGFLQILSTIDCWYPGTPSRNTGLFSDL